MRDRIRKWGSAPIVIPRWMLTLKYSFFVLLGLSVTLATSPSLEMSIGDWLTPAWGIAMVVAGGLSAVGSVGQELEPIERWASATLVVLLLVYSFSPVWIILTEQDWDRAAYSVTALALAGVPTARAWYLLRRTGIPPETGPFAKVTPL